jgi:hypothetical protein
VDEPIVNGWLFTRYLVVGVYVGLVTVYGFVWWFVDYREGPGLHWTELRHFSTCSAASSPAALGGSRDVAGVVLPQNNLDCSVFSNRHPKCAHSSAGALDLCQLLILFAIAVVVSKLQKSHALYPALNCADAPADALHLCQLLSLVCRSCSVPAALRGTLLPVGHTSNNEQQAMQ